MLHKRNQTNLNLSLLSLINKFLFKSYAGLLFAIIGPILYMVFYYLIAIEKPNITYFSFSLSGALSLSTLTISFLTIPNLSIEFRKSIILRKLKTEKINKYQFTGLLFMYFFCIEFLICLINIGIFYLIGYASKSVEIYKNGVPYLLFLKDFVSKINFGEIFYSTIMLCIISITFGMLISVLINNLLVSQLVGLGLILISMLLGGQFISPSEWDNLTFMKYLSFIWPISQPINAINVSCFMLSDIKENTIIIINASLFDFSTNLGVKNSIFYHNWMKPIYVFAPLIISPTFYFLSTHYFKYTQRA